MATSTLGLRPSPATIPLISTSLTVFYAIVETTIFIPFLRSAEEDLPATSGTVRRWWTHYLPAGLATIFSVTVPTIVSGLYALRSYPRGSLHWKLSAAGAAFAAGHFLFVPTIAKVIEKASQEEEEKKGETINWLRRWLNIHAWRTFSTDVPALACFAWIVFGSQNVN